MDSEIIEKLACLEHLQWKNWARAVSGDFQALLDIINENVSMDDLDSQQLEVIEKNTRRIENWAKYMIEYEGLSEAAKDRDRVYARKVYELCKKEFEQD